MSGRQEKLGRGLELVQASLPEVQAVYLFGTFADGTERLESDVDLALLLPHERAKTLGSLYGSDLHQALAQHFGRDVDLINLREVSTVFQNQIVSTGKLLYSADEYARQTFEMYTLSFYQKLNEERAAILEELYRTGEAYGV